MTRQPKLISITETCGLMGIGRTKLYQLLAAQCLTTVKIGRRRLVTMESLEQFVTRSAQSVLNQSPGDGALYSQLNQPIAGLEQLSSTTENSNAVIHPKFFSNDASGEK